VRGVGIDHDDSKVAVAQEKIRKARLQHMVSVAAADPLEADTRSATVVYLALGERNEDMLQALRRQLQPGARIITHQGRIPGATPQEEVTVQGGDGRSYQLCLWRVPRRGRADSSLGDIGDSAWDATS
jgi:hypothetical protein